MAKKPAFQIPSVEEMSKYEREQTKFHSKFQPSAKHEPNSGMTNQKLASDKRSAGSDAPQDKPNETTGVQQQRATEDPSGPQVVTNTFKRKGFASKFAALREDGDELSEPTSKRSTVITKPQTTSTSSKTSTTNCILVNPRQRGNPLLKSVRNIPWEFGDIVPDYVMGRTVCALFLSLRYHHLNPNYIHGRLKELGYNYELRVLLVQVDVKDPHYSLKELARMALLAECTLILAWSPEEAGRYLETYKSYENKPVDALKERIEQDFVSQVTDCLTTVKSVNKTDVVTLLSTFGVMWPIAEKSTQRLLDGDLKMAVLGGGSDGFTPWPQYHLSTSRRKGKLLPSVEKIVAAEKDELCLLPGFGPQKAQRLKDVFDEPFVKQV